LMFESLIGPTGQLKGYVHMWKVWQVFN
jgi:hypothetical protein